MTTTLEPVAQVNQQPQKLPALGAATGRQLQDFEGELTASLDALDPQGKNMQLLVQDDEKVGGVGCKSAVLFTDVVLAGRGLLLFLLKLKYYYF